MRDYRRVAPRDLFNEGNLLTCLGRLVIKLEENRSHNARVVHSYTDGPFQVTQDQSDGSISCRNVLLAIGARPARLFRPLNARDKFPLYAEIGEEEVRVFDLDGELSPEFWIEIGGR